MPTDVGRVRFVGIEFSNIGLAEATARIVAAAGADGFTTVVTPNVDHVVRIDRLGETDLGQQTRAAIADADYCLCDSRVLARLARLRGTRLPVAPGSDLTAAIFRRQTAPQSRIAIVGGDKDTLSDLTRSYPALSVTQHIAPMRMIENDAAMDAAARFIVDTESPFTFVAVGSPQGELLLERARQLGARRGVALSIGASIDFLTGRQTRAPRLVQRLGFEWAFRLVTDPKRLWRRYLVDGPRIFAIVMRRGGR